MKWVMKEIIQENDEYGITDPKAPWLRRYKGKKLKEATAAFQFIQDMIMRADARGNE